MDEIHDAPPVINLDTNEITSNDKLSPKKSWLKAKILILLSIILIPTGIWFIVKPSSNTKPSIIPKQSTVVTLPPISRTPTIVPTSHLIVTQPTINSASISAMVDDGNVYLNSAGKRQLFIDKYANSNYYKDYEVLFDFTNAKLSADNTKMYVQGYGGISAPILFYIDLSKAADSYELGPSTDVSWSPNSQYIAYTAGGGDCGPQNSKLFVFDTNAKEGTLLNEKINIQNSTFDVVLFDKVEWLADSSALTFTYTAFKEGGCSAEKKVVSKGSLTIGIK